MIIVIVNISLINQSWIIFINIIFSGECFGGKRPRMAVLADRARTVLLGL